MLETPRAMRGMITAPHHAAAESGLAVLREGGTAIEAMIAAAAAIAVVYPHMNAIGGDGFWLIAEPGRPPIGIDASGRTGAAVTPELYRRAGLSAVPSRGPLAANTVAGTIGGWQRALEISQGWGGSLPLSRLLADAVWYAHQGMPATRSQAFYTTSKQAELADQPGFAERFLVAGAAPAPGQIMRNPPLAALFERLAAAGLDDFYRGEAARSVAADLGRVGSPVTATDLAAHRAELVEPLSTQLSSGLVYNLPPPTQGLASLMILALYDRLKDTRASDFDHIHGLVEATKRAFLIRDAEIGDPGRLRHDPRAFLAPALLDRLAREIDPAAALPWPIPVIGERPADAGDTIWMGVIDGAGRAVSFIQSIYWEFGSGVVLPETGIVWQNRGSSMVLDPTAPNALGPGRKPFHTLNPALARLDDGRVTVYGTMGGEGQPQTQAAVFSRHVMHGMPLQAAVTAPRWLLGRTWGAASTTLKLEDRIDSGTIAALRLAGHDVEVLPGFVDAMGHAGALSRHVSGVIEGATDPRSDGAVAGF
ncbi:MAG TPA: gamma-glutamyltransferase family protein [Stellaceae bacterium]|nr:gamma-glutamyltransferase family protein [Stellaceae bacterium]